MKNYIILFLSILGVGLTAYGLFKSKKQENVNDSLAKAREAKKAKRYMQTDAEEATELTTN